MTDHSKKQTSNIGKTGNKTIRIKPEYDLHQVIFGCTLMLCEDI